MPAAGKFQPVYGLNLRRDDGQVVHGLEPAFGRIDGTRIIGVAQGIARSAGCKIVTRCSRLAYPLPDSINLWSRMLHRGHSLYPELPAKPLAPEHQHHVGRLKQLGDFGAAAVGVDLQRVQPGVCLAQHHRARLRQMVSAHRRQHRHPPFVVPVVRGALQFKPDALADFGFGRERCFQNVVPGVNWVEPKGSLEKA